MSDLPAAISETPGSAEVTDIIDGQQLNALDVKDLVARLAVENIWPSPDLLREILARGEDAVAPLIEHLNQSLPDSDTAYQTAQLLILLGNPSALPDLIRFYQATDDDTAESMGDNLPALGAVALPYLLPLVSDRSMSWYKQSVVADMVRDVAGNDPNMLSQVSSALHNALADYVADAHTLTTLKPDDAEDFIQSVSYLCADLADLGAEESRPLIQAAFDAKLVDEWITGDDLPRAPFGRERRAFKPTDWLSWYEDRYAHRNDPPLTYPDRSLSTPSKPTPILIPPHNTPYIAPPKPGRNDPCWCGSGKKYKKCHLNKPDDRFAVS